LIGRLVFWFVRDITQKKHTVLRNYPLIGRLRYVFEMPGEYFRRYFPAGDRDETPVNRGMLGSTPGKADCLLIIDRCNAWDPGRSGLDLPEPSSRNCQCR